MDDYDQQGGYIYIAYIFIWMFFCFLISIILLVYDLLNGIGFFDAQNRCRIIFRCSSMGILGGVMIFLFIVIITFILDWVGIIDRYYVWNILNENEGDHTTRNLVFFAAVAVYSVHYTLDNASQIEKEPWE